MRVFITGTAGFIGFHLAQLLLENGAEVFGYDGMSAYYYVRLKQKRHSILSSYPGFQAREALLEDAEQLSSDFERLAPEAVVHLAAQAGVRYSIDNPRAYVDANLIGTFNILETVRHHPVKHLMMASTSSVFGANTEMPYKETDKADVQMSFYAATKKANEAMGHSYAHLFGIPTTMFRFFTVYGPWGRPDMALFKFTKAILNGDPIDVYNHGNMWRDFTYVTDLVRAIQLLLETPPPATGERTASLPGDSLSPVAPFRIVNVGNSDKVRLEDFIAAIEDATGCKAIRNYMEIQAGDVPATWADANLLHGLTDYQPQTDVKEGVR